MLALVLSLVAMGQQPNWQVPPQNDPWAQAQAYRVNINNTTPWNLEVQVQMYNPQTQYYEQKNYTFSPFEKAFLGTTTSRYFLFRARTPDGNITWTGPGGTFKQEDMGPNYVNFTEHLRYQPTPPQNQPPQPPPPPTGSQPPAVPVANT